MVKCPFNLALDCITTNCKAWQPEVVTATEKVIAGCCLVRPINVKWENK